MDAVEISQLFFRGGNDETPVDEQSTATAHDVVLADSAHSGVVYWGVSDLLQDARTAVRSARSIAVLTGAGVSAESGIPTFRSNGGFWRNLRFQDLATPEGFARDPKLVWEWYEGRRRDIARADPNAGHHALAEMERQKDKFTLITQNVDGLHVLAGSNNVIHLHGDIWTTRCTKCPNSFISRESLTVLPPVCDRCGALMRPGVV